MYGITQLIIQILYGIPMILLYGLLIGLILKPSKTNQFKTPYFKLSAVIGFVDFVSYIGVWIMYKLPSCPETVSIFQDKQNFFLLPFFGFGAFYFPLVRSFLLVISSANRFTALHGFSWHEKFWLKFWKYLAFLCFILGLITTFPTLFGQVSFIKVGLSIVIMVKAVWDPFWRPVMNASQVTGASLLTLLFNLGALLSLIEIKKTTTKVKNEVHKAEVGLLIISFWDFIIDFIYALEQIAIHLGNLQVLSSSATLFIFDMQAWVSDLNNLTRPIFFMISSKAIRNAIFQIIGFSKASLNERVFIVQRTRSGGAIHPSSGKPTNII